MAQNVERTRAIPEEARAALELVKEHGDLLPAFEAMLAVDSQRSMVLKAITDGISSDKVRPAASLFLCRRHLPTPLPCAEG